MVLASMIADTFFRETVFCGRNQEDNIFVYNLNKDVDNAVGINRPNKALKQKQLITIIMTNLLIFFNTRLSAH